MSIDSAVSIAWDVLKYVVVPFRRQFGYVISSKSYAQDLHKEVEKLAYEAERVQNTVENARNNLWNVYSQVTKWQAGAEKALKEAGELLNDFEKASKTCCYGTLPNPICRYRFSMKARDKIEDIQRLAQECSQFKDISFPYSAPGNVITPTLARIDGKDVVPLIKLGDDGIFKSRALIMRDIMDALANNSNSVVGVYGMGGVGKSTLLVDLERKIKEEKLFDLVAKADVSENPDIKRIQGEIAYALRLDIKNEEYINVRAELLRRRMETEGRTKQENEEMKKKKVLIILDNLWKGLDLKLVGIPCGHDNTVIGCKLLLTSRDRDVLRREMCCDKDFCLGGLQEEEARRLFERMVGDKVHDDQFKPWVDEALRKCAGLPFLIVAMAKLFKDAGLPEWKDALKQIEMSNNEGISELINKTLQLSYDNLKVNEAKSLLQLCVIYGVSKPTLENLVRYSIGLGLFSEDSSIEEARDRLNSLIHTLQASSLLLDGGDAYGFKIHDLVREFVTSVASKDHPVFVLKDKEKSITKLSKGKLKSCWAICFPYVDMKELPEELDCPELQIFLLFTNDESLNVIDSYFNSMRKLTVLNLTGIRLTHSPSSFQLLENLRTLCLDGCSLEDVAILGHLKGLQILSFVNAKIHRLPKEIGQLVELRLLDLNHCSRLQVIEPRMLGNLIKLEELYMDHSFDQWNGVEQTPPNNACLIELNNMKNLNTLHVSIPDPSVLPEGLNIQKLTKYKIQIGSPWHGSTGYQTSRTLRLKLNPMTDILHKGCVRTTLDETDNLYLDGLNGIEQSICELSPEGFPKLKHLKVDNSPSVHCILRLHSLTAFKMLESLSLKNLINLEKICHSHISSKSFGTLKVVRVKRCYKMEVLFPLSLLRELPQLEEIGVVDCNLMRHIAEADDSGKVELRNLRVLELNDLPSIKNFFTTGMALSNNASDDQISTQAVFFNGQQVSIPSLESLEMEGLPNLKDIWSDESPLGLSNLQSLQVFSCISLSKVINTRSLEKLHKLQTLTIAACDAVQDIFDLDGSAASANVETLSELNTISIGKLPSLRRIWSKNPSGIVRFNNLKQLQVYGCYNLRFLFFPTMVQSLAQLINLEVWDCKEMEAIIMEEEGLEIETSETLVFPMLTNLRLYLESLTCFSHRKCSREVRCQGCIKSHSTTLFNREVAFPSLETLEIAYMDNIEMIWNNQVAVDSFQNLKSLEVVACNKLKYVWDKELHYQVKFQCLRSVSISRCESLTSLFPASVARDLIQLEELKIEKCGIVELIEEEGLVPKFVFPKLTSLKLEHLIELRCIYTRTHALHWPALKTLEVNGCTKAGIFASQLENDMPLDKQPLFLIEKGAFPNLQELKLDLSERMEIWNGHFHDEEFFRKLEVLEFHHLSNETAISVGHFVQNLTSLEKLVVCESYLEELGINVEALESSTHEVIPFPRCFQHLKTLDVSDFEGLPLKVISLFSRYFQHLKTLDMSHCEGLSNMFTPTIVGNLVELTKLRISNCKMLIEVIRDEEGKEGHAVAFSQLKYMELDRLTGLRCFSSGGYTLIFPLLVDVIVTRCPCMKFFSRGPLETPKLERVHASTAKWFWKGNLNSTIKNMFEEMATVAEVEYMRPIEFPEMIAKWHSEFNPIKSNWPLKSLVLDKCPSFINAIPPKLMLDLFSLETLQVHDCESLEEIFNLEGLEGMESTRVLPQLWYLYLVNLPKLRRLWNNDLQGTLRFKFLWMLNLYNCSNLGHVFTPSMAQCLGNLGQMVIKECGQMEVVIAEEEGGSAVEKIAFPKLEWIKLKRLPNLTGFYLAKNQMLNCPSLRVLIIAYCPKMRSLTWQSLVKIDHGTPSLFTPQVQFPQLQSMVLSHLDNLSEIWTDGPQETLTFEHLRNVKIENCKSLEKLFPYCVAISLNQLEKLQVEFCMIEKIVASADDTSHSTTTQVIFPKLISLVLHDMPQLKSFCPNFSTLKWQFLKKLQVTHCDKLNMFSFVASMNKWVRRDDQRDLSDQEIHSSFEMDIHNLERLLLVDKDIHMIHDGKFPNDIFGKAKALTLACFHDENAIFPPRILLERFPNLQCLEVFCSSFEDIFQGEGPIDEERHSVLENLRELKLSKLHNLKRVGREDCFVAKVLQSIEIFEVRDCPILTTLFPIPTSFQNLTKLTVKNSSGLIHLVTFSAITNLVHLTYMTITECERMEEVVINDGDRETKLISLGKLEYMTLQKLPSLVCFSSTTNCIFRFPSLVYIKMEECPKMKIFSKGMLSTPKLCIAKLFRYRWEGNWEGDLNTTIQKLSA